MTSFWIQICELVLISSHFFCLGVKECALSLLSTTKLIINYFFTLLIPFDKPKVCHLVTYTYLLKNNIINKYLFILENLLGMKNINGYWVNIN